MKITVGYVEAIDELQKWACELVESQDKLEEKARKYKEWLADKTQEVELQTNLDPASRDDHTSWQLSILREMPRKFDSLLVAAERQHAASSVLLTNLSKLRSCYISTDPEEPPSR